MQERERGKRTENGAEPGGKVHLKIDLEVHEHGDEDVDLEKAAARR